MARQSPTELATEVRQDVSVLRKEFELFVADANRINAQGIRERRAVAEERIAKLEEVVEEVKHIPVILDRLNKLEEERRESHKRGANFIYAVLGISLGVVGNLIVSAFKKS